MFFILSFSDPREKDTSFLILAEGRYCLYKFKSNLAGSISSEYREMEAQKLDRSIPDHRSPILFFLFFFFLPDRCCESLLPVTPVNQALEGYHPWDSWAEHARSDLHRLYGRPVSCCLPSSSPLRVLPTRRVLCLRSSPHTTLVYLHTLFQPISQTTLQ